MNAHTPWTIRENPNKEYPDLPTYSILEPNPDAGRNGVSYSGDLFMVCTVDSLALARLIAQAPAMLEALRTRQFSAGGTTSDGDVEDCGFCPECGGCAPGLYEFWFDANDEDGTKGHEGDCSISAILAAVDGKE